MEKIEPKIIYRIINQATGKAEGVYSRSYHDKYDFDNSESARNANCWGIYQDKDKYKIAKYRVIYELLEEDAE
jgi:hypothetical protein